MPSDVTLVLSFSAIRDWITCRQLSYYRRTLGLRRKITALPLKRGIIIHELLDAYHEAGGDIKAIKPGLKKLRVEFEELMDEEKELYGDLPTECERLIKSYHRHWGDKELKTLATEVSFGKRDDDQFPPVELVPGVALCGRIDRIAEDERGVWIGETKSTKNQIPTESHRLLDLQTAIYTKVAPKLGFPDPVGIFFDYLKTKPPTIPKVLKSGELSVARKIKTDYATFMAAIKENNLDPAKYAEALERAKATTFFSRKFLPKPAPLVDALMKEIEIIGREMRVLARFPYRSLRRECEQCSFYSLCLAELLGLDTDYLLKYEYTTRKEVEAKDADEDEEEAEGEQDGE